MVNRRLQSTFPAAIVPVARPGVASPTAGRIAVVAPHPDDETLGCGSLLARRRDVAVVLLTDGTASHPGSARWPAAALARLRRGELRRALARLGASGAPLRCLGWRDGALAATGNALRLRRTLLALKVRAVLVTSPRDHHADHQAAFALTLAATRGTGIALLTYAVWSRLAEPAARSFDPARAAKRRAMAAHRSQTGPYIADDPAGFTFAPADLARLLAAPERFAAVAQFVPATGTGKPLARR